MLSNEPAGRPPRPATVACPVQSGGLPFVEVGQAADFRMHHDAAGRLAGWFHVTALLIMGALSLGGVATWWAIIGPHMVLSFGSGMIGPNASAGAVSLYPRLAGTASSWVGLAQMGMGALGTIVVAVLTAVGSRYIALPMAIGLLPFAICTVLASRLLKVSPLVR